MKKRIRAILPAFYGPYYNVYSLIAPKKAADSAFHLFSKVRKGRVQPQQAAYLDRAKLAVEAVSGHQVQSYHWPGKKPTVLLVHGWESNTYRWRNLIQKLREADFDILAFDAPAHGYSSGAHLNAPLYEETVRHMVDKYGPSYLVGHSMGGMTIVYNQYKNPNPLVKKMVTIGAPSEFHEIMEHFQQLLKFNDRVWQHLDQYIQGRFGFGIQDFSAAKFSSTLDKKGLIFHDRLDPITPYHASVQLHGSWKGSTLISTEGLGHSMHQDQVNDQIVSFLEG